MIDPESVTRPAQRLHKVMLGGALMMLAFSAAAGIAAGMDPQGAGEFLAGLAGYPSGPLMMWQNAALMALVAGHLTVWVVLFLLAAQVFDHLAEGSADRAATVARQLSYWLWGMLVWGVVSQMLASVVATWGFGPGERALAISFGTTQISIALSALIAGFMARAFALGAELWRDHREVV